MEYKSIPDESLPGGNAVVAGFSINSLDKDKDLSVEEWTAITAGQALCQSGRLLISKISDVDVLP